MQPRSDPSSGNATLAFQFETPELSCSGKKLSVVTSAATYGHVKMHFAIKMKHSRKQEP